MPDVTLLLPKTDFHARVHHSTASVYVSFWTTVCQSGTDDCIRLSLIPLAVPLYEVQRVRRILRIC